ncbi:MAG: FAD-dependent oxidoreductase [Sedimentisphaerales bacterium]|nr:FAD-dependent oxidoreductase [Sedimentisphaerales bacterium]
MKATADQKYFVRLADINYWQTQIKCQSACPVHTDARGYVRAIADGKDELAYLIARGPNPLASICGRICGAPCETECRRRGLDQPIAIRALKRFVCEKMGPESRSDHGKALIEFLTKAAGGHPKRQCQDSEELLPLLQSITSGQIRKVSGKSIGIIGGGPAGLAAAHDLTLLGFSVTIYEMEPILAGMLAMGVPEYRLSRAVICAEVDSIMAMGIKAVTNCCVGKDITFAELRSRHDAVVVAVGAKRSRQLAVPGANAKGVIGGVEFLRDVSLGNPPAMGRRIVVVGGGNVAYDVGRSVLRQIALDAARTAKREPGVAEVYMCSLESLEEMPADDLEIIEGDEEGIIRRNSLGPVEITSDQTSSVRSIRFKRCLSVYDANRRFSPIFDENDITEILCDNILIAIGQSYDLGFIDSDRDKLKMTERGLIACDPQTGGTSAPDVYVAGDLAYGPKLLIHAVASGKAVARSIYQRLTGCQLRPEETHLHFPIPDYSREADYEIQGRITPEAVSVAQRLTSHSHPVEQVYSPDQAQSEASRCLDCGVNTIFDGERCILCGGCVDVCPQLCLRIVLLDQIQDGAEVKDAISRQLADFEASKASAILKDETICIRCGLCAERCPTGAITMEAFCFEEKLR